LVPSNAKYKVYIIDEVHMLTNQAFNALLKTLEEPPSHVIFILATTEPSKIPLTISSRCQKFRFSKISDNKIVDRLKDIVKLENINIDNDALFEIARVSDGGMRDSINMLDQLISYSNSKITLSDVYAVNGSVSYDELFTLINDIYNNDKVDIINFVDKLDNEGKEIIKFLQELLIFLKDVILYKNAKILSNIEIKNDYIIKTSELYSDNLLYDLIENLNDVQNVIKSSTHGSIIFMTFILKFSDAIYNNGDNSDNNTIKIDETVEKNKNSAGENNKKEKNISREIKKVGNIQKMSDDEINVRVNNALATASKGVLNNFKNNWSKIDDYLTDEKFSVVSGLLKDFVPVVASEKYVIVASDLISMVDRINDDIIDVEMFFRKLFDFNIFVVAITTDRWKDEKNKYVSNIKNGIKYYVKELNKSNVDETKNNNPVDELIDLLGDSVIEYK
jgi:DNA polymerase III subunit gamma/tau